MDSWGSAGWEMVRTEGVEPSPRFQDQILSLARLPIPPRSPRKGQFLRQFPDPRVWIVSRPTDRSPALNLCLYGAGMSTGRASAQKCTFLFRATFRIINEGSETILPLEGVWDRANSSVELIHGIPDDDGISAFLPTVGPGSREADISDQPSNQLRSKTRESTAGAPSNRPERVELPTVPRHVLTRHVLTVMF